MEHTIDHIKKAFQSLSGEVKKFVLTLGSYFLTIAQIGLFEEAGIEEYQITSAKDDRTCPQCTEMDGRHFKLKEFAIAQTAPPFHFFCRCMIIPFGLDVIEGAGKKIVNSVDDVTFSQKSIDHAFGKHKGDFGNYVDGSKASVSQFTNDLKKLIETGVQKSGTYRSISGTHIYNPSTQQWMFINSDGSFNAAFKLSAEQFKYLIETGVVK